jgi:protein phosphatase
MRVRWSARSDVGLRREVNQDSYGTETTPFGYLLVVCDGMGGHAAGEVASRIGVDTIIQEFIALPSEHPVDALRHAFITANQRIYNEGRGTMGTTGVAALFHQNVAHVANVGDSRAYLIRDGKISQISRDHSLVSDQVAAGLLTPEQARSSSVRNIITRALGHQLAVDVDHFRVPLQAGDTILLSSDGMHGLIEDDEIAEIASILPPDEATRRLVDDANGRGGIDNITVVIAQVDELDTLSEEELAAQAAYVSEHDAITDKLVDPAEQKAEPIERPLSSLGLLLASLLFATLVMVGSLSLLAATPTQLNTTTTTTAPTAPPPSQTSPAPTATTTR